MSTATTTRILIVDDHPLVRQGLSDLIAQEPDLDMCGQAASAGEAFEMARSLHPDLVLVDLSLKDVSGMDLIKQLEAWDDSIRMLVVSMLDEALYAERVLHAGAMGFVNKDEATDVIIKAIRRVLQGRIYLSEQASERILGRVVKGPGDVDELAVDRLSDRELEVFELIGSGSTTRQIAERMHLSPKTIETYRDRIKTKLGLANTTELMRHAVKRVLENE
ncbi:MAG: DNA-binding response regulator [Phycisphaeraceae bacterium]|nr:DNA-binding response regulator [Phycisphaeraceae bacterium]